MWVPKRNTPPTRPGTPSRLRTSAKVSAFSGKNSRRCWNRRALIHKAIFDADALTTELSELLIDRVLVYSDKRIEIAYKIRDIFD